MNANRSLVWGLLALFVVPLAVRDARSCPFCSAPAPTLSEEIAAADAAVLAQPVPAGKSPAAEGTEPQPPANGPVPKSTFRIVRVLKGQDVIGGAETIEAVFFGEADPAGTYFITALGAPAIEWTTPLSVTPLGASYLEKLLNLPEKGPERLRFFHQYLQHKDPMLAQDAYDEFARAPYAELVGLKDDMDHEQIVAWIRDPEMIATRRKLFLVMLSVCGGPADLPMLEEMIRTEDRSAKTALDAVIGCYLSLRGEEGLPLIEQRFLKNPQVPYQDIYAAVTALRYHAQDFNVVPRARVAQAIRNLLEHPDFADQVIPDLARWEDWQVIDRLVALFKASEDPMKWVRISTINFLRVAEKQQGAVGDKARAAIEDLTKVDPEAARRASLYFALGSLGGTAPPAKKDSSGTAATQQNSKQDTSVPQESNSQEPSARPPRGKAPASTDGAAVPAARTSSEPPDPASYAPPAGPPASDTAAGAPPSTEPASQQSPLAESDPLDFNPTEPPGLLLTISTPLVAFAALVVLQWGLLRPGRHERHLTP